MRSTFTDLSLQQIWTPLVAFIAYYRVDARSEKLAGSSITLLKYLRAAADRTGIRRAPQQAGLLRIVSGMGCTIMSLEVLRSGAWNIDGCSPSMSCCCTAFYVLPKHTLPTVLLDRLSEDYDVLPTPSRSLCLARSAGTIAQRGRYRSLGNARTSTPGIKLTAISSHCYL